MFTIILVPRLLTINMDVEKSLPTAPSAGSENILGFEFLLDPTLLAKHLSAPKPDPSPFDLVTTFLCFEQKSDAGVPDSDKVEGESQPNTFKSLALKILTMKVMAHLKWDLDLLEPKLPSKVIMQLLINLFSMATKCEVPMDPYPIIEYKRDMDHQTVFAMTLYHRWILKALVYNTLAWKHPRMLFIPTQGGQDPNMVAAKKREDFRMMFESQAMDSVSVLSKIVEHYHSLTIPTFESFAQPTETSQQVITKWVDGEVISAEEFRCQLHFELGQFLMFRRDHEAALSHVKACLSLFNSLEKDPSLKSTMQFCRVNRDALLGLAMASGALVKTATEPHPLNKRFRESKWNQYQDIIPILQMDNLLREIPLPERNLLEIEIQQAVSCGTLNMSRENIAKLQILNAIRRVLVRENANADVFQLLRNGGDHIIEFFITSIHCVVFDVSPAERKNLYDFLFDLLRTDAGNDNLFRFKTAILADEAIRGGFPPDMMEYLDRKPESEINIIPVLPVDQLSPSLIARCPSLEIINIQHQLSETFDIVVIKSLVQKLDQLSVIRTWYQSNSRWDIAIPLQSAIMNMPKGYVRDYIYILLAKSRELCSRKEYKRAIMLLETAIKEGKESKKDDGSSSLTKLVRLISWEILLVEINEYLQVYPEQCKDPNALIADCKSCLAALSASDSAIPRLEIQEGCAVALLNLCEWEYLMKMDKRFVFFELASALANACQDIVQFKGAKMISRDAWKLILPAFALPSQKRNNVGNTISPNPSGLTKSSLVRFLLQLREPTVLAAVTSLLAKQHNVLRDESSLEINCLYVGLWPAMVTNSNSYNAKHVAEVLLQITTEVLKFSPNNFSILKLIGDINYASSDWASALKYYLESAAIASEYFTQPIPKAALEDSTLKRMIKCCSQLNCHTQAAVLCQCLDDVDYSVAFRCLTETKSLHCADAMDAYYPCIWDLTLLEYLVNMHNKRGETQRKQQVIKILGLLELNGNNNEEIQREAANIRRNKLFRALIKQYSVALVA